MSTRDRLSDVLVNAVTPLDDARMKQADQHEVDTSCPHVPFGFVRIRSLPLKVGQEPDDFWSYAISIDELLDPLSAKIEALDASRLESVFVAIHSDLARAGKTTPLAEEAEEPVEVFSIENACENCCGRALLVRYPTKAKYVHWHRES